MNVLFLESTHLVSTNRPKFPEYDKKLNHFLFETRTKQGRQVAINVYIDMRETNYVYRTSIEELIRKADNVIREVRCCEHPER